MKHKVAVVQMMVIERDKGKNLKKALELLEQAAQEGAEIACFPDWFLTDTPTMDDTTDDIRKLAEPIPGPVTKEFSEKAKKLNIYVVAGTMAEKGEDGRLYATSPVIDPKGKLIGKVRKAYLEKHVPGKYEFDIGITLGSDDYPVIDTEIGKIGVITGISVEEPIIISMKGAGLIFCPFNLSTRWMESSLLMIRSYSMPTCAYIAVAGRVGWHKNATIGDSEFFGEKRGDLIFAGGSQIVFFGETLARVPNFTEGVAVATMDTDKPEAGRKVVWDTFFRESSVFAPFRKKYSKY